VKEWLYFLTDESGKSYSVVNGVVKRTATPKPLFYTPDGWQDLAIAYERQMAKIGVVRSYTPQLGLVMDGATIMREVMYNKSIEEKMFMLIQQLAVEINTDIIPGYYALVYKYFYKGELDLSTLKDQDSKVLVNIMEGGLSKLLKANEATTYEFDLDTDPEAVTIEMDGIFLQEKHNFASGQVGTVFNHIVPTIFINKEGQAFGAATFTVPLVNNPSISPTSEDYFLFTSQAINDMVLSGSFNMSHSDGISGTRSYNLRLKSSTGQDISIATFAVGVNPADFPWTVTFDAAPNEKFWLYAVVQSTIGGFNYFDGSFALTYKSRYRTSYVKGLPLSVLFKRLIGRITGSENNADVSFLQAYDRYVVTSGDGVRSLTGAKIKTTLNQFFECVKTILCAGMGIEGGKVLIHTAEHFFGGETNPFAPVVDPINLGEVKDLVVTPATDLINNTVKVGYQLKQIDDVNGKYEFNTTHTYSTPVTRVVKELSIISPYNAAPYAMEIERINFEGKNTTDSKNDNEIFLIDRDLTSYTNDDGTYYKFRRDPTMTITGVPDPDTIFNVSLSPTRILLTWQRWINSMYYKLEGQKVKYQTSDRNADLKTVMDGVTVQENSDMVITADRIFLPFYFEFDTQVPIDLVSVMEANPNRKFQFTWLGSTFTGYLMKAGIAPNTNKEQAYKLLAAASNDMTNLL
jgi:hypothetical protein